MSTISQLNINGKNYDIMDANARASIETIGEKLYPVGSIYLSLNNTNPATLFGFGVWESLNAGYALWTSVAASYLGRTAVADNTGAHTLKAAESGLPAHAHSINHDHPNKENKKVFSYSYKSGNPGVYMKKFSEDSNGTRGVPTTVLDNGIKHLGYADWSPAYIGNSGSTGGTDAAQGHTHTTGNPARIYVHAWKRTK